MFLSLTLQSGSSAIPNRRLFRSGWGGQAMTWAVRDVRRRRWDGQACGEEDDRKGQRAHRAWNTYTLDTPTTIHPERQLPTVTLVRRNALSKWTPEPVPTLRINDIIFIVSLLELANTVDVGANVFNANPPSRTAIIVMALGGTLALLILPFAILDVSRSIRNLKILSRERTALKAKLCFRGHPIEDSIDLADIPSPATPPLSALEQSRVRWKLNSLEVGLEAVDRLSMDILMGIGALLVGVGTLLAIGGGDPKIYKASNLLTGYIGNVLPAISGLGNTAWSFYRWHSVDWPRNIPPGKMTDIYPIFRTHQKNVRRLAMLNIWLGILGAAGSLMTASAYIHPIGVWGYVLLVPCIIGQMVANRLIRNRVHYTRDTNEDLSNDMKVVVDRIRKSDARRHTLHRLAKQYRRDKDVAAVAVEYLGKVSQHSRSASSDPGTPNGGAKDSGISEVTKLEDLLLSLLDGPIDQFVSDMANHSSTKDTISSLLDHRQDGLAASLDVAAILLAAQKDSAVASTVLQVVIESILSRSLIWEEEAVRRNLEILLAMCRLSGEDIERREVKDY